MTAIADIVQYEKEFPLKLLHPSTREEIGVTFMVRHIDCEAATAVARKPNMAAVLGGSEATDTRELYAACIAGWDWGGMEFEEGKGVLEYSPENALYVMRHPGAKWIVRQVMDAVVKIGNFTNN